MDVYHRLANNIYTITNSKLTPEEVAIMAIKELAKSQFLHEDIEWRHVGLLPIIENDIIVDLKPVLIDLYSVVSCVDEEFAIKTMSEKLGLKV